MEQSSGSVLRNCGLLAWLSEIIHRRCIEKEEKGILWKAYGKQKGRYLEEKGWGNIRN